ncbi:MAG: hypothetical protein AB8B60_15610 [Sulfitobacter sp.]
MLRSKGIITAVGALGCALGIGYAMQSSDSAQAHYGAPANAPETKIPAENMPVLEGASAANAMLDVQEITLTSAEFDETTAATQTVVPEPDTDVLTAAAPGSVLPDPETPETAVAPAPECLVTAAARPIAAAMVELSMQAPCYPDERITVHHNGMIFTETTSDTGDVTLRVPALARESVFILAFPNGEGAVAQTTVEELEDYNRAVLQWKGTTGFQIHAREFDAEYGASGHIWEGAPGDMADTVIGAGGMITRHGDTSAADALVAEVYSFPKAFNTRDGNIALSVETEVTQANCGLEIEAQSLEILVDGQIKTQNLTLPVPECDAEGSFLVLNNLLQDMKVVGNKPGL